MAVTKPLIFDEIEIADAGGANAATFDKHLVDSAEVTLEPGETQVEDGQTLTDFYDAEFQVDLYDASVLEDARVYTDASEEPVKADLTFKKATGAAQLELKGVYINGRRNFENNRTAVRLTGSKRSVSVDGAITES